MLVLLVLYMNFDVQGMINGDICKQFLQMSSEEQEHIAQELSMSTEEILKCLYEVEHFS